MGQHDLSDPKAVRHYLFLTRKGKRKSLEKSNFIKLESNLIFLFYKHL